MLNAVASVFLMRSLCCTHSVAMAIAASISVEKNAEVFISTTFA